MSEQARVVIPASGGVWPHELDTAKVLAASRGDVEFIPRIEGQEVKSPDIVMGGVQWEMKAPVATNVKSLQRVLRRASTQSSNVIIDSSRMKGVPDARVERELRRLLPLVKGVRRLILVNKCREVVDIKR